MDVRHHCAWCSCPGEARRWPRHTARIWPSAPRRASEPLGRLLPRTGGKGTPTTSQYKLCLKTRPCPRIASGLYLHTGGRRAHPHAAGVAGSRCGERQREQGTARCRQ
ncbi:unnamed protein product, partial [Coccothraustes coccothraustes]